MMSSEEDPDLPQSSSASSLGGSGAKSSACSGSGSAKKRVRQRVDAGEPRNSYASIPNFSSRPPPGCSPLAALYSNGYAASKMLCDLLGSSARQQQEEMIVLEEQRHHNGIANCSTRGGMFVCDLERCSSGESSSGSNSHLLRDILQQGREGGHGPASPLEEPIQDEDSVDGKGSMAATRIATSTSSSPPPADSPLEPTPADSLESKRARVETIVSNMLSVPKTNGTGPNGLQDTQPSVNGCKKRKLYQPQQHEKRTQNGDYDDEEFGDESSSPVIKRRNMSTNGSPGLFTFKQQLRHMQQQLVAMQQQYLEMLENDSTDEENNNSPGNNLQVSIPNNTNNSVDDHRPKSADSTEAGLKPAKTEPVSFVDYDNASMYDNGDHHPRRLVIDDSSKDKHQTHENTNRLSCQNSPPAADYEWLAESLKAELSTSLSKVVDAVVSRCVQRKAALSKMPMETSTPQDPSCKDPTLLSQMLDRKSPRTGKVIDRGTRVNGGLCGGLRTSPYPPQDLVGTTPKPPFFFPLKPPASVAATAAFLYGSPPVRTTSPTSDHQPLPEQTEAMSLVVPSKKKRHKVTDTRLRPPLGGPPPQDHLSPKYADHPLPPLYHHPPPPLVPVSLPTSVAIPNPSLNQSELFHGYDHHHYRLSQHFAALEPPPPPQRDDDDNTPIHHPLHPLLTPFHRGSPDYSSHLKQDSGDMSDTGDSPATYDSSMAMISFLPSSLHTSTLTPMHLRKAKLMFFFARYPSSAVLKMYFPDIRFNKNNTAQLVKWFSNFREFFYIQMEKYARQAITEGVKTAEELKVNADSELLRVLNLHYNRNNHIPSPEQFRFVVEQTLREFYKALVAGKDSEQSWKKSIYKIIARMDDSVPDYFKSPNFLDTLE